MNAVIAKTLFQITQKQNMEDVDTADLSQLAHQYPYFAPAQVLLAAKLKADNNFEASSQLQKVALFVNNPFWLEHGLFNGEAKDITIIHAEKTNEPVAQTINSQEQTIPTEPESIYTKEETIPVIEEHKPVVPFPAAFEVPTVENVKGIMEGIDKKEETHSETIVPTEQPETIANKGFSSIVENSNTSIPSLATMPSYSSFFHNKPEDTPEEPPLNEEDEEYANKPDDIADSFSEKQVEKLSSILSSSAAELKKPVAEEAKLDYPTEPAYTVDYFASQGIKVDLTKQPQDKLTVQLLKFTDWLKIIKRSNPNPTDLGTDPELESAIQGIAQTSNESREIITETMADVFVKQGKIDKAVQLYIKLSFLEPEKSSYFAAKIQELKGI
ncbi:MAG: hypothetical protein JSR09_10745 [Bacteroidetes bacterium]|nr:hypothetical protein [Bacteroidota bacterium]MBS1650168.1 hypothetical protein [Bacteroidota bacterium]